LAEISPIASPSNRISAIENRKSEVGDRMNDANDINAPKRPLSEISHLFLSGIRDQAGGEHRPRPVRVPPNATSITPPSMTQQRPPAPEAPASSMRMSSADVDLTPEEFASVFGNAPATEQPAMVVGASLDSGVATRRRVTAVFGATPQPESIADAALAYAASLAARDERIGVIALDGVECRVQCVACEGDDTVIEDAELAERVDARELSDALTEMNHDVDRWLVVIADPRRGDAREALRRADDWTMLSTCDHDGIVGGYRALKGLAEGAKAPLAIALIDAPDAMQANKVYSKLAGVCRQFLDWDVRHETLEDDVEHASVRTAYRAQARTESTSSRAAWSAISGLLALAPDAAADHAHYGEPMTAAPAAKPLVIPSLARPLAAAPEPTPVVEAIQPVVEAPAPVAETPAPAVEPKPVAAPVLTMTNDDEVIDLPEGTSVLSAVLKAGTQLLATPIAPPMCPGATIAVGRDRALVLVAQAGAGLAGVDAIAAAVRWLDESKQLVAMAMPQLAIDASVPTRVLLLVDQADRAAIAVRPLFAGSDGRVSVRSYRRLRWAGRVGLLLEAA
jgi:hypothetical protein